MLARLLRLVAVLAMGVAAVYVGTKLTGQRRDERRLAHPVTSWPDVPLPEPAAPQAVTPEPIATARTAPGPVAPKSWTTAADGVCPESHPVKAKRRSMLYHLPGMSAYGRTQPDRCYLSPEAAEADGFTRARR